ncbi:MAG: hypothetical protein AAGK21_03995 [Bacteroidota bacterium]
MTEEDGGVSVEFTVVFTGLVVATMLFADGAVGPLAEHGRAQAALNAESVAIIEEATAVCGTPL